MADKAETPAEHPLNKSWSLWFKGGKAPGAKGSADDWDCGTLAFTFNTAENFWGMYNNIKPASKLPDKSDYYLFVDGIKPKYEDPKNEGGGEWRISIPRGNKDANGNRRFLDDWFLHTALGCIGEILDEGGDVISGVAVNIRKREDRVAVWTRTCDPAKVGEVGRRLRELLKIDKQTAIKFQTYADGKAILEA